MFFKQICSFISNLYFSVLNLFLCKYFKFVRFLVACNRPENDEHWSSDSEEWKRKASMSAKHRFLIIKGDPEQDNKIHWQW